MSNDYRDLLVDMRDRILPEVTSLETVARDLASLTQRLLEIADEIHGIDAAKGAEAASEARKAIRGLLVTIRGRVGQAVNDAGTPARDLAALSRRLLEVARRIEAIDAAADTAEDSVATAAATPDETWDATAI